MKKLLALLTLVGVLELSAAHASLEEIKTCARHEQQGIIARWQHREQFVDRAHLVFTQQDFTNAFALGKLELAAFMLPRTNWERDRTGDYWYHALVTTKFFKTSLEKAEFLAHNNKFFKLDAELLADLNVEITTNSTFDNEEKKKLRSTLNRAPKHTFSVNDELLQLGKHRFYGTFGKK